MDVSLKLIDIISFEPFDYFYRQTVGVELKTHTGSELCTVSSTNLTHAQLIELFEKTSYHVLVGNDQHGLIFKETHPYILAYKVPIFDYIRILKMSEMSSDDYLSYYAAFKI